MPQHQNAVHLAIDEVAKIARRLIDPLTTTAQPRDRDTVAAEARTPG